MIFTETILKGSYIVQFESFKDARGEFSRYFCKNEFNGSLPSFEIVQINHSLNYLQGTIRGMHYQKPPFSESKLIRCIKGKILDVIIDLRENSHTFLRSFSVELSEYSNKMIFIPQGFAHGFQTLEDNTEILYHHTEFYNKVYESGIRYNDPSLNIQWPLAPTIISEKDINHPYIDKYFTGIIL